MHIERSFRDTGLRNDIIDRDRFHGLPGKQRIRSGNELGASPRSLLSRPISALRTGSTFAITRMKEYLIVV